MSEKKYENAYLAGGCFWCTEAIFQNIKGVVKVTPGYSGGVTSNPNYESVSNGKTNHTEAIEVVFDPKIISFKELVYIFFRIHNPTTLNQQGNDIGSQYRSAIFYTSDNQKLIAENEKSKFDTEKIFDNKSVTEIVEFDEFYPAENYHKDYYNQNSSKAYCQLVISPKLDKFKSEFGKYLK